MDAKTKVQKVNVISASRFVENINFSINQTGLVPTGIAGFDRAADMASGQKGKKIYGGANGELK